MADAVVEFVNETFYTEETGVLDVIISVNSSGTFQSDLIVELEIIPTALASEYMGLLS